MIKISIGEDFVQKDVIVNGSKARLEKLR